MEEKTPNKTKEVIKSILISVVPITLVRTVLDLNFHISNAALNFVIMFMIFSLVVVSRNKVKTSDNNDLPILVLLILFFPAGLHYLWNYSNRSQMVKIIVTSVLICILFLLQFIPE